jgi:signal transduction histidine kinase
MIRGTVRVRTTLVAVVVVGLALAVGGVALVVAMRHALTENARESAEVRAEEIARGIESGTPARTFTAGDDDDIVVRVVDAGGAVVAESAEIEGVDTEGIEPGTTRTIEVDDEDYAAAAVRAGDETVIVARTMESVGESTEVVAGLLLIGLPVLLVVVAVTTWLLAGRALAPVEAMRREVDTISAQALDRRVPQPAGSDEIARLASTMNQMLDRLDRSQRQQRQFVSDASHELRSPIASIREQSEVALAHPESIDTTDLAQHVLAEDLRLQRLVEDMLVLARVDERSPRAPGRAVDLDDVVFDTAKRLRLTTAVRIDTSGVAAVRVLGDQRALERVVGNVAENAARHARTRMQLALHERDGQAVLVIDDDGAGIPPADRERVFERFVRLDDARTRDDGGSGLGLAITAELVRLHGGTISVADAPGGGARVEIRIPAAPDSSGA